MDNTLLAEELKSKTELQNTDINLQQSKNFSTAGLNSYLVKCYMKLNYQKPTPIQYYSIATYLERKCKSIVAQSKSGTGKTLSYLSILLSNAIQLSTIPRKCTYLIILPTRQLSLQVYQTFKQILNIVPQVKAQNQAETKCKNKLKEIKLMMCIGGIPFEDDRRNYNMNGGTVVVGTIGRIIQFFQKKLILINQLEMLILDEGDKLFENKNKKFNEIVQNVMKIQVDNAQKVQIMIYSATFNSKLIKQLTKNRAYTFIQTLSNQQHGLTMKITDKMEEIANLDNIVDENVVTSQSMINLENIKKYKVVLNLQNQSIFNAKCKHLITLLQQLNYQRCLVFVQKKMLLQQINQRMIQSELEPLLIHGSLSQSSRIKMMNQINQSKIIVASDLLARGIDLELDLVILFDAKKNDTFWHRIGRTGRYGSMGVVISLDEIADWKQYTKQEAQSYLDQIRCSFDKNKEWYGTYLTQIGHWNVTSKQKQLKLEEQFRYFDEQKFIKGRKKTKRQEDLQQTKLAPKQNKSAEQKQRKCSLTLQKLLQIKSEEQLKEIIKQFLQCSKCQKLMESIEKLTGYKFKIGQLGKAYT